jgi:thioredoxin 1
VAETLCDCPAALTREDMSEAQIDYLLDHELDSLVSNASEPFVLLDFTADWCGPCIAMEPIMQAIATEYANAIRVVKVDLDYSPGIAERFGVLSIPTLIILKNGEQASRIRGPQSKQSLIRHLEKLIAESQDDRLSSLRKVRMESPIAGGASRNPIAEEGDPNLIPWRNRPDGPVLEWATASELQVGDRVVQSNKYVHTVTRSEPTDSGLWALTIEDPRLVRPRPGPTDAADRWMTNVTDWMPKKRELRLLPGSLYRRIRSDDRSMVSETQVLHSAVQNAGQEEEKP